ncbi:MAG: hypothetical protein H8E30_09510 [Alphaproteobacteria bacterium]|nr:hypothetical protein [Alphaproteobacteria bacterium]
MPCAAVAIIAAPDLDIFCTASELINNMGKMRQTDGSNLASIQFSTAPASVFFDVTTITEAESCLNDLKIMKSKPAQQTANNARGVHFLVPFTRIG